MNLISFANFNISDNQPSILPATEKDGKPEDFSAILNNIFVALQTANSPAPNFSGGFEQNNLQVQTVPDGGQNFVLSNNQILSESLFSQNPSLAVNTENLVSGKTNVNQNILPTITNSDEKVFLPIPKPDSPLTFAPNENLLSIPENFQPASKLPTMQNVLRENRADSNSFNNTQNVPQDTQTLSVKPQFSAKDFEIVSNSETNIPLPRQNYSFATPINTEQNSKPLQIFKNISDSIRKNDLPVESAVKVQPVLTENNLVEIQTIPIINSETVQKIDSPDLKVETISEVVNFPHEENVIKPIVLNEENVIKPTVLISEETPANPTILTSTSSEAISAEPFISQPDVSKESITAPINLFTPKETISAPINPPSIPTENVVTKTNVSEILTTSKVDTNVSPTTNSLEAPQIKLPIVSELKSKMESPIDFNLRRKVTTVVENESVKIDIPNNVKPTEVLETSIVEPKSEPKPVVNSETKVAIKSEISPKNLETKPISNFDVEIKGEVVSEKQPDQVKLPIEAEVEVKTEVATEPQINLKANENPIPIESKENPNPKFSFVPTINEIKTETKPSQPISLNLDSDIAKSTQVKPLVEPTVSNASVQPKFENNILNEIVQPKSENNVPNKVFQTRIENVVSNENSALKVEADISRESILPKIENILTKEAISPKSAETTKPNLTFEANKPILTDEDFRELNLQFEKLSKPVSVENKPIKFNSVADKIVQPDLAAQPVNPSITELPKTNLLENAPIDIKPQTDAPPMLPKTFTETVNPTEIKVDKPALTNFLNNLEKVERNPIQVNPLPEHQKLNQSQNTVSNPPIQTESKIKIADLGTSQNFTFSEKPEQEFNHNEVENNLPASFEKVIENAIKETNIVETTLKNQTEPTKIAEQINPHLIELANLVEKKQEKEILKLRLHPAELGSVEITLERDKSGVLNAHFKTETAEAQQALSNGLEQLRDTLQNAGWEVGQLDISNGSSSSTSNQNRQNNQQKPELVENFAFNRNSEQPDETESNSPTRLLNLQA